MAAPILIIKSWFQRTEFSVKSLCKRMYFLLTSFWETAETFLALFFGVVWVCVCVCVCPEHSGWGKHPTNPCLSVCLFSLFIDLPSFNYLEEFFCPGCCFRLISPTHPTTPLFFKGEGIRRIWADFGKGSTSVREIYKQLQTKCNFKKLKTAAKIFLA